MDRIPFGRPYERELGHDHTAPPPSSHASPFGAPPTAQQPQLHIPFSDPFSSSNRDPFLPGGGSRRGSLGPPSRAWQHTQGNIPQQQQQQQHHSHQLSPPLQPASQGPPPSTPYANGLAMHPQPYDDVRRRSVGGAGSPQHYGRGPIEPPPAPAFPARNMPPPSPPQHAPHASHLGAAPRGPSASSPFSGVRDLGSHRPGMSISAILGGGEERKPNGSPHSSVVAPASTPSSMRPPSPGRARSSSMREVGDNRWTKNSSSPRPGTFGDAIRTGSEPRNDGMFGSPQLRREPGQNLRAFQPAPRDPQHHLSSHVAPVRPNSQPVETNARRVEDLGRGGPYEPRAGTFRHFGEPPGMARNEPLHHENRTSFQNGITSHPQSRSGFSSPQIEPQRNSQGATRLQQGSFGTPLREEQASLFRPAVQPTSHPVAEPPRESIEVRPQDMRRHLSRRSPPPQEMADHGRGRFGFVERPMTLEEHQRLEMMSREQQRKESEGPGHRAILNISPELHRRGRNSPLPQAVQGAQPRHIGPGGDNPGIKMEFGRMFSGLGAGVGSTTPKPQAHPPQPANGTTTPSRISPSLRHVEGGDLVRAAVAEIDERRGGSKPGSRASRRNRRRSRDNADQMEEDDRNTPDLQRNKRTKTNQASHHHHHHVYPHHHHHHHHEAADNAPGPFNLLRSSNPLSHANLAANQAHHHHHHHAHPGHHHHHAPRAPPAPRKPAVSVISRRVIEETAKRPRRHLGSQLYSTEVTVPRAAETSVDAKIKFSSRMKPIPVFAGHENCTFTVRVPRDYLASSDRNANEKNFEEICKRRQLWGTDIYTDDSDVIAAAVHSGWIKGDFGEYNEALKQIDDNVADVETDDEVVLSLEQRPARPVKVPDGYDAHITLVIILPLESYAGTHQNHIWSRDWNKAHDGMSYMIHAIDFVDEGAASRYAERGAAARKMRITMEEANRREAAAGLLMFANGTGAETSSAVKVGA